MIYVWLLVIAVSLVVEAVTASLVSIWFIPSAIVSALLARLGAGILAQVLVFLVLSILLLVFARRIFSKLFTKNIVPTNVDALVGESAVVITDIDNLQSSGVVKVKGQTWSAKSENGEKISKDTLVEVTSIEGVKLVCRIKN